MREHARSLTYVITAIDITRQLPMDTIIHAFSEWLYEELPDDESDDPIPWHVYVGMLVTVSICAAFAWRGLFGEAEETVTDMQVRDNNPEQELRAIAPPPRVRGDMLPNIHFDGVQATSFFYRWASWISGMVSVDNNVGTVLSLPVKGSSWWGWSFGLTAGLYTAYRSAAPTISYPSHNADHPINNPPRILPADQFSQARQSRGQRALYQLARYGLPLATVQAHITSILPLIPSLLKAIGIHAPFEPFMPAIRFGGGIGFYFVWQSIEDQLLLPNLNAHFRRDPAHLRWSLPAAGITAGFSAAAFFWYFRLFSDFQFRYPEKEILSALPAIAAIPGLYYRYAHCAPREHVGYHPLEEQDNEDRLALERLTDREQARAPVAPHHQRLVMVERGRVTPAPQAGNQAGNNGPAAAANEEAKQQLPAAGQSQRFEIVIEGGNREIKSSDIPRRRGISGPNASILSPLRKNSFLNEKSLQRAKTTKVVDEQGDSANSVLPPQRNIKVQ